MSAFGQLEEPGQLNDDVCSLCGMTWDECNCDDEL